MIIISYYIIILHDMLNPLNEFRETLFGYIADVWPIITDYHDNYPVFMIDDSHKENYRPVTIIDFQKDKFKKLFDMACRNKKVIIVNKIQYKYVTIENCILAITIKDKQEIIYLLDGELCVHYDGWLKPLEMLDVKYEFIFYENNYLHVQYKLMVLCDVVFDI